MQNSILQWLSSKLLERPLQPRELLTARKLVYVALIVVLFTASFFWRKAAVDARAVDLAIRQDSHGDVELSGELVRLSLTGSRGLAVCILWNQALEKQKKNQWNELEILVRTVTKLQPHFITPWLFQSWNLAYNVSVESDRVNDKYFYITRGVDLLAEGERQNRNHPDMRFSIGFYTQHKIMVSDQTNVLRSLFQLSMIPPSERDPDRFIKRRDDGGEEINWVEFEKFVTKYPQLARRLHSGMLRDSKTENQNQFTCRDAEEVVRWLRDNWHVPALYVLPEKRPGVAVEQKDVLLPPESRFPPLPPPQSAALRPTVYVATPDFKELTWESNLDDTIDGYCVARAWYGYAQEPIPRPGKLPGENEPVTDRVRQRRPKHMTTLLFRNYPALAQSAAAERLEQEGWFRPDAAEEKKAAAENRTAVESWDFPEDSWFKRSRNRFADGRPARLVLQDSQHADKVWGAAHSMWRYHGELNHLTFADAKQEAEVYQDAVQYAKDHGFALGTQKPAPTEGEGLTGQARRQFEAAGFMFEYVFYRNLSNFPHHFYRSKVEANKTTVLARRNFYAAETAYQQGDAVRARAIYDRPEAIATWRDLVLLGGVPGPAGVVPDIQLTPIDHRTFREDMFIQEYTFETQLRYIMFFNEQYGSKVKQEVAYQQFLMGRLGDSVLTGCGAPLPPDLTCWLFPIQPLKSDKKYAAAGYALAGRVVAAPCGPLTAGPLTAASLAVASSAHEAQRNATLLDQPMLSFPQIYSFYALLNGPFDVFVFDVDEKEQPQMAAALLGSAFEPLHALFVLGTHAKPLIEERTKQIVRERKGLTPRKPQPAPSGPKKDS